MKRLVLTETWWLEKTPVRDLSPVPITAVFLVFRPARKPVCPDCGGKHLRPEIPFPTMVGEN